MMKPQTRKLRILGAASLLSLALVAAPASADHGANLVAPIVTAIALGAILHHGHHRHHRHHRHYRHDYHGHGHGHGHYRPHKRKRHSHSYGYGGYEPRKGHKPYKGHKSHKGHRPQQGHQRHRGDKYAGYKRHDKRSHW